MEDITDADYPHGKRVCKYFKIKKKKENILTCMFKAIHYYKWMYLKTFEICLEIYELDPSRFFTVPGVVWLSICY